MTAPSRRTQAQRREATIAALVEATIAALAEVGYVRTTTNEIARRAGVSQGALFRHFDSRLDVVLAAADAVRGRQLVDFRAGLAALAEFDVGATLQLLRRASRAPINAAWFELLVAARTDAALRDRLAPLLVRFHEEIVELGRSLPIAATMPREELDTIVISIVHLMDGEALAATIRGDDGREDRRLAQLVRILAGQPLVDTLNG